MTDVDAVGGKNASLGEMISQLAGAGIRVPGGFATTAFAFREFLAQHDLASRIEGLNKELGTTILISAATAARLGAEFQLGRRAVLPVKGKELPVEVVEVLGCAPGARRAG